MINLVHVVFLSLTISSCVQRLPVLLSLKVMCHACLLWWTFTPSYKVLTSSQPSFQLSQLSHQCNFFRSQTVQPRISHCVAMSPSSPPIWNSPSVFVFHDHTFGPLFCRMFLTLGAPGVFFLWWDWASAFWAQTPQKGRCVLPSSVQHARVTWHSYISFPVRWILTTWMWGCLSDLSTANLPFFLWQWVSILWGDSLTLWTFLFLVILLPTNFSSHQLFSPETVINVSQMAVSYFHRSFYPY